MKLVEMTERFGRSYEPEQVYRLIFECVSEVCPGAFFVFAIKDEGFWHSFSVSSRPVGEQLKTLIEQDLARVIDSYGEDSRLLRFEERIIVLNREVIEKGGKYENCEASFVLPLQLEGRLLAVFMFFAEKNLRLPGKEIAFFTLLSYMALQTLRNLRLHRRSQMLLEELKLKEREHRRQVEILKKLFGFAGEMRARTSLGHLFHVTLEAARTLAGASSAAIYLINRTRGELYLEAGLNLPAPKVQPGKNEEPDYYRNSGFLKKVFETGRPYVLLESCGELGRIPHERSGAEKIMAAFPIFSDERRPEGLIVIFSHRDNRVLVPDEYEMMMTIADILSTNMSAILRQRAREEFLARKERELGLVFSTINVLNSIFSLPGLISELTSMISEFLNTDSVLFFLRRSSSSDLVYAGGTFNPENEGNVSVIFDRERAMALFEKSECERYEGTAGLPANVVRMLKNNSEKLTVRLFALRHGSSDFGILVMSWWPPSREPGDSEKKTLENVVALATVAVATALLYDEKLECEYVQNELEIARHIQARFFPKSVEVPSCFDVAARSLPARTIGGDYYDVIYHGGNVFGAGVADVSGKGIPAALIMVMFRAMLRTLVPRAQNVAEAMSLLNVALADELDESSFVTFAYAMAYCDSGRVEIANAGMNPIVLVRSTGQVEVFFPEDIPLGVIKGYTFHSKTLELQEGDLLVMMTDGITEAKGTDGEFYGLERFKNVVSRFREGSAGSIIDEIVRDVKKFASGELADDCTVMVIKRKVSGKSGE